MKYFWFYVIISILVMFASAYFVTLREQSEKESKNDSEKDSFAVADFDKNNPKYENAISNMDIEYHMSEDQIRETNKHKMNVMYVKGDNGRPVGVNMESTQNLPTYYTPGSLKYDSSAYVPTYEDAIKFSSLSTTRLYGTEYNTENTGPIKTYSREEKYKVYNDQDDDPNNNRPIKKYDAGSLDSYRNGFNPS